MRWVRRGIIIAVVVAVIVGIVWEYRRLTAPPDRRDSTADGLTYFPGSQGIPLPPLTGTALDDTPLNAASLQGHPLVINVWGSWCAPCVAEAPALAAVSKATYAQGIRFIGIDIRDSSTDQGKAFEARFGIQYPSFYDPAGIVLAQLTGIVPIAAVPSTVFVDRHGIVRARVVGRIDLLTLQGLVADTAAGK